MMRVLHVISSISRTGGGPSRSSQGLVAAQRESNIDAWLMMLNHGEEPWIKGCDKFVNGGSFDDALARVEPDIVHIHGIWQANLHKCAVACRRKHIPYVIAPRGMLEPWSLKTKWLKKRIARFLYQDRDLRKAAALHATAESEAEQFRKLGFKNPVIISPNGVNVPEGKLESGVGERNLRRALFVSRMHPKKGVLELVEAWARVFKDDNVHSPTPTLHPNSSPPWQCELVYTLNGDEERAYEQRVKDRIRALGLTYQDKDIHCPPPPTFSTSSPDFILTGPLNDDKKWEAYARADLFVLPTYSENFGIVVAEALYAGVPVITTKGTPWSDLEGGKVKGEGQGQEWNGSLASDGRCGWWIELPSEEVKVKGEGQEWRALDDALREATSTGNLRAMGENGRRLVEQKYLWSAVVKAMVHGYEQVLNTCELAPCDTCDNYGDTCSIR